MNVKEKKKIRILIPERYLNDVINLLQGKRNEKMKKTTNEKVKLFIGLYVLISLGQVLGIFLLDSSLPLLLLPSAFVICADVVLLAYLTLWE